MNLPTEWGEPYANGDDTLKVLWEELITSTCYVMYPVIREIRMIKAVRGTGKPQQGFLCFCYLWPPLPKKFWCDPVYIGAEHM